MFVERVAKAIVEAERAGRADQLGSDFLTGFSGLKLIDTMRRIAALSEADPTACYLEIGVFQGLTLLSVAASVPNLPCLGIDNFAYLDPENLNFGILEARRKALGIKNARLINADFEDALESLEDHLDGRKIAVYFIDGPHDYRSQLMCLELALPFLHENCVIVVDDSNYSHVRQANRDFLITHPQFRLIFEAYTPCHPENMSAVEAEKARSGWWDGVNILVRDPHDHLDIVLPPTDRSRALFEQDHVLHAAGLAEHTQAGVELLLALHSRSPRRVIGSFWRAIRKVNRSRREGALQYSFNNTHSADLPRARLNPSVARSSEL